MGLPGREGFLGLSDAAGEGEGENGVLDRVWRIFSTNAFRTTVKGVKALGGEKAPEGWEKEVEFHSTFVEGESPALPFVMLEWEADDRGKSPASTTRATPT